MEDGDLMFSIFKISSNLLTILATSFVLACYLKFNQTKKIGHQLIMIMNGADLIRALVSFFILTEE
jgi:hypothetical protein